MNRRRAATRPGVLPAVLLLVVGVLVAIGVPTLWAATHRDPALAPIQQGLAIRLAQTDPGTPVASEPPISAPGAWPTSKAGTLTSVPPVRSSTSAMPRTSGRVGAAMGAGTGPGSRSTVMPGTKPGVRPAVPRAAAGVHPTPTAGPTPVPTASSPLTGTARPPVKAPTPRVPPPASVSPPVRLQIPDIGVDAPVDPVGLDAQGDMAVPNLVQTVGWYRFGPAPGSSSGSIVMSGHVDSAQQGLGAFARLGEMQAGDLITVFDAAGRRIVYRVAGKEAFDKSNVPLAQLFSRAGAARLTLITCGGDFDSAARSYVDNIVVTAVPA